MIAIIDYNAGNLKSVQKAFEKAGVDCIATADEDEIFKSDAVVLPGVGAFADCMHNLKQRGMEKVVLQSIQKGMPFLGICLGFQMLFEDSEEHQTATSKVKGIGIFKGTVRQFPLDMGLKVPHMGWNSLEIVKPSPLLEGLPQKAFVYFVHSYYVDSADRSLVSARCDYGVPFDAAISHDNVHAVQFHPEKSGDVGLLMIRNFVKAVYKR